MQLDALLWMFLPVFVAGGSALLSFFIMQARMEVALAKERESLAEARATINSQNVTMEERSYIRESKSLASSNRSMVMQERLFFRNIPLSNWIEHEMVVEEGGDLGRLQQQASVFAGSTLPAGEGRLPISKMLDDAAISRPPAPKSGNFLTAQAAFGAQ